MIEGLQCECRLHDISERARWLSRYCYGSPACHQVDGRVHPGPRSSGPVVEAVNQIIAGPAAYGDFAGGLYQIGDVYARSCVVMGTLSSISMPKRLAS